MAIRIRKVRGRVIAICAASSKPKPGDIYLDDNAHYALSVKFDMDFAAMGFMKESTGDRAIKNRMRQEEK